MRAKSLQTSILILVCAVFVYTARASDPIYLPNGLMITPDAAPHSSLMMLNPGMPGRRDLTMGQAVTTALSPDGSTLLVMMSTSSFSTSPSIRQSRSRRYEFRTLFAG
jgi:hypothetical protein